MPDKLIDERGFACIGPADDRDKTALERHGRSDCTPSATALRNAKAFARIRNQENLRCSDTSQLRRAGRSGPRGEASRANAQHFALVGFEHFEAKAIRIEHFAGARNVARDAIQQAGNR